MNTRSITIAVFTALLTALTLAGSVWALLFLTGPNSITRLHVIPSDNIPLGLIVALTVFLCGGGLWGLGIARLMNADAKSMVKACALSWSATVFTFLITVAFLGISLGGFSRIIILPHFRHLTHHTHYNFLSVFVPIIGIITAINAYVVTGKLGFKELKRSVGLKTGVAAALGFLAVGLILLYGFGWEVGRRPGMLMILLICSIGATLAGGASLGWMLSKAGSARESRMENMNA